MLRLPPDQRAELWRQVVAALEQYETSVDHWRVSPKLDPEALRSLLSSCTFEMPMRPSDALSFAINGLTRHQVHTPHPRYFGLFNPAPTTMGVAADALVAAFNPQLAAWSHSPLAAEIERHLVLAFGERFGWDVESVEGTFTRVARRRITPDCSRRSTGTFRSSPIPACGRSRASRSCMARPKATIPCARRRDWPDWACPPCERFRSMNA